MLIALIQIVNLLISVLTWLIIVQFVLSLLIAFNVVSGSNDFVRGFYRGINALLDPALGPIRKVLPDTRPVDFSPLVLILAMQIVSILLQGLFAQLAMV